MKRIIHFLLLLMPLYNIAQIGPITIEPDGGNKKASVSEQVGIVKISINYNRPGVKGREGKIWNTPVAHYGFRDLGHGTSYAAPWRAGANENTTISFSHPVSVEGKSVPAGTYGLFMALGEENTTLILSKISTSWGSFYYDSTQDQVRVSVPNKKLNESVEWLKYEFVDQKEDAVTIAMSWEKRSIPFTVTVDRKPLQLAAFVNDFRTTRTYYDFVFAANWCLKNNYGLEQALEWMDRALYFRVMGEESFLGLQTKARILERLNRKEEAKKTMLTALPLGSMQDVHFYARQLLSEKNINEAFNVFKLNFDKHPNEYTTNVGMARAHSAKAEFSKAIPYIRQAINLAKDQAAKENAENLFNLLKEGKNIN